MDTTVREAAVSDLPAVLRLYAQLHGEEQPKSPSLFQRQWEEILRGGVQHVVVAERGGRILSTCTAVIVPNLTHGRRPYALIENVVTDEAHRGQGLASLCLAYAKELAVRRNCYKLMLMTGSKSEATLRFYERAGYNRTDKTAFVQWLE